MTGKILKQPNVILVGMPGAGKSTLGVLLAKVLGKQFVDTDLLIQSRLGKSLQQIVDEQGYQILRKEEEKTLLSNDFSDHVVATGGSAIYSETGMRHLKQFGPVVFLDLEKSQLLQRVTDYETRGIARRQGQSFDSLFDERQALYRNYADITVCCNDLSVDAVLANIQLMLASWSSGPPAI